jgi:hypothetical protein
MLSCIELTLLFMTMGGRGVVADSESLELLLTGKMEFNRLRER